MSIKFEDTRRLVVEAGQEMLECSLVVGTWGNISARVPNETLMAITPSGVDYETITPEQIVIMDFNGNIVDGALKPSIEYNLHGAIYRDREDVKAVMHTHSTFSTAFALARKPIPAAAEDLVQIVGGDVRISEYFLPGTPELAEAAIKALEGRNAAILANHGCLAVGPTLKEVLKIVGVVEKSAQATIYAQQLGGVVPLCQEDVDCMRDFYLNHYGQR
jgi:L-fuculose-phosphate aldolase